MPGFRLSYIEIYDEVSTLTKLTEVPLLLGDVAPSIFASV
jgi:hypothetical protein